MSIKQQKKMFKHFGCFIAFFTISIGLLFVFNSSTSNKSTLKSQHPNINSLITRDNRLSQSRLLGSPNGQDHTKHNNNNNNNNINNHNIINNHDKSQRQLKIFQIGLHKVGTTSLQRFFKSNSIPSLHWRLTDEDIESLQSIINSKPNRVYLDTKHAYTSIGRIKKIDKTLSTGIGAQFQSQFERYLSFLAFNQTKQHRNKIDNLIKSTHLPQRSRFSIQELLDYDILQTLFDETANVEKVLNNEFIKESRFRLLQPSVFEEFVYFGDFWLGPETRNFYTLRQLFWRQNIAYETPALSTWEFDMKYYPNPPPNEICKLRRFVTGDKSKITCDKNKDIDYSYSYIYSDSGNVSGGNGNDNFEYKLNDACQFLLRDSINKYKYNNTEYYCTYPRLDDKHGLLTNHLGNLGWFEILDKQYENSITDVKFILNIRHIFDYILSEIKQVTKAYGDFKNRKFGLNITLDQFNRHKSLDNAIKNECKHKYIHKQMYTLQNMIHALVVHSYAWNCKVINYCKKFENDNKETNRNSKCIVFDIKEDPIENVGNFVKYDLYKHGWIDSIDSIDYTSWYKVSNKKTIENVKWYFHYDYKFIYLYNKVLNASQTHKIKYPQFTQRKSLNAVCPKWFDPNNGQFGKKFKLLEEDTWDMLL